MLLAQNTTPIIGTCAKLLGKVMEWIYVIFSGLGIENIGLCIIIFTLLVKIILFPLQYKQQKFSKLSKLMNPEIQAIQAKYKGKRDNESMMKMNEETRAVYEKYGTSPTGSCLQLLIQLPILFSLYYIISSIPSYVPQVEKYYEPVSNAVYSDYEIFEGMNKAYDEHFLKDGENDEYSFVDKYLESFEKAEGTSEITDVLAKYSTEQWNNIIKSYKNIDGMAEKLATLSDEDWKDAVEDKDLREDIITMVKDGTVSDNLKGKEESIKESKNEIMRIYKFGPINLSLTPSSMMGIALLIPILSFLTQVISMKISMANTDMSGMEDNPMASSMKTMNIVMPIMSGFIAYRVPAGLGLYWVSNGFIQIISQLILNSYFKKTDIQDIIDKNVEKMNKKKAKMNINAERVTQAANINTKSIKTKANANVNTKSNSNSKSGSKGNNSNNTENKKVNYKKGSMAEKANLVQSYNNKKK